MYDYRRLSKEQQREIVRQRRLAGLPLHEPPHRECLSQTYLVTAANYGHAPFMGTPQRRDEFEAKLLERLLGDPENSIHAWCVLPNHYHVLMQGTLEDIGAVLGRLHNGTSTQWNREDGTPGRRVWFRLSDRGIRHERHFWAAFNYVNANAVKHGYVRRAQDWAWCSVHQYIETQGVERLRRIWREYPVLDFGRGWDW